MSTPRHASALERDLAFQYESIQKLKTMVPRSGAEWALLDRMEARMQGVLLCVDLSVQSDRPGDQVAPVM
jgi:hypothetical protein